MNTFEFVVYCKDTHVDEHHERCRIRCLLQGLSYFSCYIIVVNRMRSLIYHAVETCAYQVSAANHGKYQIDIPHSLVLENFWLSTTQNAQGLSREKVFHNITGAPKARVEKIREILPHEICDFAQGSRKGKNVKS